MTERKEIGEVRTKEDMMQALSSDTSKAFLEDVRPEQVATKLQAQSEWWQNIDKDKAPSHLNMSDLPELKKQGWTVTEDQYYNRISRQLKDGTREVDIYQNRTGEKLNTVYSRYATEEAQKNDNRDQSVEISFRDGVKPFSINVRSGNYESEFRAYFNENGGIASANEFGKNKDSVRYSFREDGSLYEALTLSRRNSDVINDQLFNKAGQPRSDYNPLYLYERAARPVENIYLGIREIMRSNIF